MSRKYDKEFRYFPLNKANTTT